MYLSHQKVCADEICFAYVLVLKSLEVMMVTLMLL